MASREKCKDFLELIKTPTMEDYSNIANKVGCSIRTVRRAKADMDKIIGLSNCPNNDSLDSNQSNTKILHTSKTKSISSDVSLNKDYKKKYEEYNAFTDLELIRHGARETLITGIINLDSNLLRIGLNSLISYNDKSGEIKEAGKKPEMELGVAFKYYADKANKERIEKTKANIPMLEKIESEPSTEYKEIMESNHDQ